MNWKDIKNGQHDQSVLNVLAFKYYGDSTLWWYLAKANNLTAMNVPAGKSLRIPASTDGAIGG